MPFFYGLDGFPQKIPRPGGSSLRCVARPQPDRYLTDSTTLFREDGLQRAYKKTLRTSFSGQSHQKCIKNNGVGFE